MKISTTSSNEILVQFTGRLRPFRLRQYHCNNPDCPYNEVALEFVEVEKDGSVVSNPIRFFCKLDLQTWQERRDTKRSEQISALVDEFLRDLSDEMKAMLREKRERRRQRSRKLASFTMPVEEIAEGRLVSFSEIMSDEKGSYDGFPAFGFKFVHEGQTYLIDDLYCPNPKCKCNEVYLRFLIYREETTGPIPSEIFVARLSFRNRLEFIEPPKCSESQARELVYQWQQSEPDVLDNLRWWYKEVRKATKRILQSNRKSSANRIQDIARPSHAIPISNWDTGFSNDFKVGRNALCPCGSGKKYKEMLRPRPESWYWQLASYGVFPFSR